MQLVACARPDRPLCASLARTLLAGLLIALSPVTSSATDWYVEQGADIAMADGSAANPFAEVQDAITAADDGDTIHIAPGEYQPGLGESILIDKDLSLIGTAQDHALTRLIGHGFGPLLVVEAGAVADLTRLSMSLSSTGVIVEATATATLTRCVISGAHIKYGVGGGLYNAGTTTLVGCDVFNNHVGVLQFPGQSPEPVGDGGGLYNAGTMTIVDTLIRDNFAADCGGGIANAGTLTLDGASVIGNGLGTIQTTQWGGGIAMLGGTLAVAHSTIAHNICDESGGGLSSGGDRASTTLDHTLLASNSPSDGFGGAFTSLGHNAFDFAAPAQGAEVSDLYDVDPQFAASGSGVLLPTSPCIDAGDHSLTPSGLDLAGNPRLLDGDLDGAMVIDIGAHEFSNVQLGLDGDATPGGTLTFHTSGTPGLHTTLLFSAGAGEQMIAPYGTLLVGADFGRIPWLVAPAATDVLVPFGLPVGMTLVLQLVAFGPDAGTGNLSNAVTLTID